MAGPESRLFRPREGRERRGSREKLNKDAWFQEFLAQLSDMFGDLGKIFERLWGTGSTKDKARQRRVREVFGEDVIPDATDEIKASIERTSNHGVPAVRELFAKNAVWREHLRASTQHYNVCPETVASIMRYENAAFDPTIVNPDPKSNATGLGQFTGGTWRDFCKSHNERFKNDSSMQFDPVGDRLNPKAQIWAISWLCNRNAQILSKNTGMNIDANNPSHAVFIYLAHHDGPGRATDVIKYLKTNGEHKFDIPSNYLGKTKQGIKIDGHKAYVQLVLSQIGGGVQAMTTKLVESGGLDLNP